MITYSGGELKHIQCSVEKPDGEGSFGRHRRIKMDLKEVGWLGVDWNFWLRIETSDRLF